MGIGKGWKPFTSDEAKAVWAKRPKCINHPTSLCTSGSLERGERLCWRCDPVLLDQKKRERADMLRRAEAGKRRINIPESIVDAYEKAILDDNLVELREDIAVTEARIQSILKTIKDNPKDSAGFSNLLRRTLDLNMKAARKGAMSLTEVINNMKILLDGDYNDQQIWQEYYKATDTKRKLVEAESKRLKELGWSPEYVFKVVLELTNIMKVRLNSDDLGAVLQDFADSPIINGSKFHFIPSVDLTTKTMEDKIDEFERKMLPEKNITPIQTQPINQNTGE